MNIEVNVATLSAKIIHLEDHIRRLNALLIEKNRILIVSCEQNQKLEKQAEYYGNILRWQAQRIVQLEGQLLQ